MLFVVHVRLAKQIKSSYKKVDALKFTKLLELLHMDLLGPIRFESIGDKKYIFMTVNNFSQLTWVRFLKGKSETFEVFLDLWTSLIHNKGKAFGGVVSIHLDLGTEFQNSYFGTFCSKHQT